jgi:hypothetical protein
MSNPLPLPSWWNEKPTETMDETTYQFTDEGLFIHAAQVEAAKREAEMGARRRSVRGA